MAPAVQAPVADWLETDAAADVAVEEDAIAACAMEDAVAAVEAGATAVVAVAPTPIGAAVEGVDGGVRERGRGDI